MSVFTAPFKVFSGTNSRYLAEKICESLKCPLGKMKIEHFSDGEFHYPGAQTDKTCPDNSH